MTTHIFDEMTAPEMDSLDRFYAVIPAGGDGTRLWPLSRANAPKFLHDLTGIGSTLIRATYDRLHPLCGDRILVVTGESHRDAVCRQLTELADDDLVLETEPKDSGAAIGLAAAILFTRDPAAIMGSFAADQVISPDAKFRDAVREAIYTAATGKIVTIGIKPTHARPDSGILDWAKGWIFPAPPVHSQCCNSWKNPVKKLLSSTYQVATTTGMRACS